jgi:phenylacetate-coenzyme A ligase PaaK-like adenylate-forming protein
MYEKHCGFIHMPLEHHMELQEKLLMRQIRYLHRSRLWKKIVGEVCPQSPQEFRETVPMTTYEDYREIFMEKLENFLPAKVKVWAHTTGSTGDVKWIPYTEEFYDKRGDFFLTAAFLSSGSRGAVPIQPGDVFFYTIAPPPYGSGLGVNAALEKISLTILPPFEEAQAMSFTERTITGFKMAIELGRIDIIGGMASVLVSIGRMFEAVIGDYLDSDESSAKAKENILRKYLNARRDGRPLLPKEFFSPKIITCAGADVSLFADAVEKYWGKRPSECYGLTESGLFAIQPFGCQDMVLVPNVAYLEFVPEERYNEREPATKLINELEVGSKYEPVVTNFYGGCVFRYRTGDLIEVVSLRDSANGIDLPMIRFFSRADNVINLSGMIRLNEKACWRVMEDSGVNYKDWMVTKEVRDEKIFIHFYVETFEPRRRVLNRMRKAAARTVATFDEIPEVLGYNPLDVTILTEGTFVRYRSEREAEGADLGQIKPMHVNPKARHVERIEKISSALRRGR